jgi:hypothetical protein
MKKYIYKNDSTNIAEKQLGFFNFVKEKIIHTDIVLDIGSGIAPMKFFEPKFCHIIMEPFIEYVEILRYRYRNSSKHIILNTTDTLEALKLFGDFSVDSIFLLDVVEHMEKDYGLKVIKELERIAKRQIIIFTPLGFDEQDCENDEKDSWGLGGSKFQHHHSGWFPEDFDEDYDFYIAENYHLKNWKGDLRENGAGSFYAIKNINNVELNKPKYILAVYDEFKYLCDDFAPVPVNSLEKKNDQELILRELIKVVNVKFDYLFNKIDSNKQEILRELSKIKRKNISLSRLRKNIKKEYQKIKSKLIK